MHEKRPIRQFMIAVSAVLLLALAFGACSLPPAPGEDEAGAEATVAPEGAAATETDVPAESTVEPETGTGSDAASEPEASAEPVELFEQDLAAALATDDVDALQGMMRDPFRLAVFQSEGRIVPPDEAAAELVDLYLTGDATPLLEAQVDLETLLGTDPLTIWGDDAGVVDAVFVSGLGDDASGEAILALSEDEPGVFAFAGALLAPEGFGGAPLALEDEAAPAEEITTAGAGVTEPASDAATESTAEPTLETTAEASAEATAEATEALTSTEAFAGTEALTSTASATTTESVTVVTVIRMTNLYPAPDPDAAPHSLLRRGDEFVVLGADETGDYLAIACPDTEGEMCWVVDDPGAVRVFALSLDAPIDGSETESEVAESDSTAAAPTIEAAAVDLANAEEITFADSEVAASVVGQAAPDEPIVYFVQGRAGQAMTIDLASSDDVANFTLVGAANGQVFKRNDEEARIFVFTVPATQAYVITVESPEATEFALTVVLPPQGPQGAAVSEGAGEEGGEVADEAADATAEEPLGEPLVSTEYATPLTFDEGETSLSEVEIVLPNGDDEYVLRGAKGETLQVSVKSIEDIVNFSIVGVHDGEVLKSEDDEARTWSGVLSRTQDYLISAINTRGVRVEYTLTVSVGPGESGVTSPVASLGDARTGQTLGASAGQAAGEPAGDAAGDVAGDSAAALPEDALLVEFAEGATSEFLSGSVAEGEAVRYALEAQAGQTLSISFYPAGPATFSVAGVDGEVLKTSEAGGRFWSAILPSEQAYVVTVSPTNGAVDFDVIFEIAE